MRISYQLIGQKPESTKKARLFKLASFCDLIYSIGVYLCSLQSFAISQANCSEYSSKNSVRIVLPSHPNHAEGVYEIRNLLRYGIATQSRMESSRRDVCNQAAGRYAYTLARDAIRLRQFHTMRKRIDSIPSLRLG